MMVMLVSAGTTGPQVTLRWARSTDNMGLLGYDIRRNGVKLATASATSTSYIDKNVTPDALYTYTVEAIDLSWNGSGQSAPAIRLP